MEETGSSVPKWILVVSALFSLIEILAGITLAFFPATMLDSVDLEAGGVEYVVYMWAVRQFALGFIIGYATWRKSAPMLMLCYIFLLVMFAGDILTGMAQKETSVIIAGIIMCIVSILMIVAIRKRKQKENT